jgi:hypothetical protein
MNKIYPEGVEVVADSAPLTITKTQRTAMVNKAKELFDKPIEHKDLKDLLEQHYIKDNKHYTSAQLKDVVDQVASDLAPVIEAVIE